MRQFALLVGLLLFISFLFAQPKDPPRGEKCVVCGMDVNMVPELTSQLRLRDGRYVYTESPKHAIQYYLKHRDEVSELWVKDYATGKWIDGTRAYYVVIEEGPMGHDLVAFRSMVRAKKFAKGRKVHRFTDIDAEFLEHLDMGHEGKDHRH